MTEAIKECLLNPELCPTWLTTIKTILIPKSEETNKPKNYRPITCLSTFYKIIISIIKNRIHHLTSKNMLPMEQKGCKKGSYGCKDQLLINKAILEEAKKKRKNLSTAWIDYKKAFDSIPHDWIIKCLKMYKIFPIAINFLKESMEKWKTSVILYRQEGKLKFRKFNLKRGIFQSDSLSPLLFCLTLAPLSTLLNEAGYGYKTKAENKVNHLLYMDDLKTFVKNDNEQTGILNTVKKFSDDINMDFGLEKCSKTTFIKGKLTNWQNVQLDINTTIKDLEPGEAYKYLGMDKMKEKIRKEFLRRIRSIMKTELNAKNIIIEIKNICTSSS